MKYRFNFIGSNLDHIANGTLQTEEAGGRVVSKGAYGKPYIGSDDNGLGIRIKSKGGKIVLNGFSDNELKAFVKLKGLFDEKSNSYITETDVNDPVHPFWKHPELKKFFPYHGLTLDDSDLESKFWIAYTKGGADSRFFFQGNEDPPSRASIVFEVIEIRGDEIIAPAVSRNVEVLTEVLSMIAELSEDHRRKALKTFPAYAQGVDRISGREVTKLLCKLFENGEINEDGETVIKVVDGLFKKPVVDMNIEKLFDEAVGAEVIGLNNNVFVLRGSQEFVLGDVRKKALAFLGKPENEGILNELVAIMSKK